MRKQRLQKKSEESLAVFPRRLADHSISRNDTDLVSKRKNSSTNEPVQLNCESVPFACQEFFCENARAKIHLILMEEALWNAARVVTF